MPNLGIQIFPKNRALSLLSRYGSLTSCTISRKTYERIPRKVRYKRTNELTKERTDRPEFIGSFRKEEVQLEENEMECSNSKVTGKHGADIMLNVRKIL